jgi:hypothetical protein
MQCIMFTYAVYNAYIELFWGLQLLWGLNFCFIVHASYNLRPHVLGVASIQSYRYGLQITMQRSCSFSQWGGIIMCTIICDPFWENPPQHGDQLYMYHLLSFKLIFGHFFTVQILQWIFLLAIGEVKRASDDYKRWNKPPKFVCRVH